jgi:hypothetical protein
VDQRDPCGVGSELSRWYVNLVSVFRGVHTSTEGDLCMRALADKRTMQVQ